MTDPRIREAFARWAAQEMQVRERLVHEVPMFTANGVPGPRDRPVACSEIRRLRHRREIFGVRFKRRDYFPAFQFRRGVPKPIVGRLLNILRMARREENWLVLYWFVGANAWLDPDGTPSSVMDSNEEAVIEAAIHAHDRISD